MYRSKFTKVVTYALLSKVAAQVPQTRAPTVDFSNAQHEYSEFELHRRQLDSNLTAGTISITIAPDKTCGFDNTGDPAWTCANNRRCSWESGRINRAFCGWDELATSCLDSTVALDTSVCDDQCLSNKYNARCTSTQHPVCVKIDFGNGISTYGCNSVSTKFSIQTTQSLDERKFSTMVLVDGTPLSSSSSSIASDSNTITTHSSNSVSSSSSTAPATTTTHHSDGAPVGAIVGGVVGGVAGISLIALGIAAILIMRRRKRNKAMPPDPNNGSSPQPQVQSVIPDQNTFMSSPGQMGMYGVGMSPNVKSQGQMGIYPSTSPLSGHQSTQSPPPIHEMPSPAPVQVFEMDGSRPRRHDESIQELG